MNDTVVIVTGAAPLDARAVAAIPSHAIVIAADGGLDHARAAGLTPAGLIGDLDSVSEEGLAWAKQHATIQRHPIDKDATDTELAVAFAAGMNPARVVMVAGGGDRLDHTLAAIGALGATVLTSVPLVECWWGGQYLQVVHGPARVSIRTATSGHLPGLRDADLTAGHARAVHRRHVVGHPMATRPDGAQTAGRSRSQQHRDRIRTSRSPSPPASSPCSSIPHPSRGAGRETRRDVLHRHGHGNVVDVVLRRAAATTTRRGA